MKQRWGLGSTKQLKYWSKRKPKVRLRWARPKIEHQVPTNITQNQISSKKGKRKVQGVPQSQTAALPRPQEEEETDNLNKHKPNKRTKSTKISSLFPKRGNRNTKRTEKHKNKMTHGKTYNKSPRRINHKATKNKPQSSVSLYAGNHHRIWGLTRRRAIKEGSKVINRDLVNNHACSLSYNIQVCWFFIHRTFNLGLKLLMNYTSLANLAEILSEYTLKMENRKFRVIFAVLLKDLLFVVCEWFFNSLVYPPFALYSILCIHCI